MKKNLKPPYNLNDSNNPEKSDLNQIRLDLEQETYSPEIGAADAEQSSYRQIFKATSLFGGVQGISIIIGLVRTKFVAILLGATGVGLMGLYNAPLQLILSITGLGFSFSAVREIAEAQAGSDQTRLARTIFTVRRWSLFAGILGTVVTLSLAPYISKWTFGNRDYTWAFILLSFTLIINTVSDGQHAIIQGVRRLKDLAKTTVYGSIVSVLTAIPLYYFFGLKGIVPAFIIISFSYLFLNWHFASKIKVERTRMSLRETIHSGKEMVKLGLVMTATGMIGFFTSYILKAFISRTGGVNQVGFFNSGWSIIGQSTGLIFTAMTTDYFPRLSGINQDDFKIKNLVNQQAEMVLLILTPIIMLLIIVMPLIIRVLYTAEFLPVVTFANWMLVSILLKGFVWPVGFIFPAKGDLKVFGIIEVTSMLFNIVANILGYHFYGLEGLGVSYIAEYLFGITLTFLYAYRKYKFKYSRLTLRTFFISLILVAIVFMITYIIEGPVKYYLASIVLLLSLTYYLSELNKRLDLKEFITGLYRQFFKRKN